mgnify:CR=1 FL=1
MSDDHVPGTAGPEGDGQGRGAGKGRDGITGPRRTGAAPSGESVEDRLRRAFRTAPEPTPATRGRAALRLVSENMHMPRRPAIVPADPWEALTVRAPGPASQLLDREQMDEAVAGSFDHLRTTLLKMLRANGWNRVAIAAPTRGCGTTYSAAHLAHSLAQVPGSRTLLMDLNLRRPGLAAMLDMPGTGRMRAFLGGQVSLDDHVVRTGDTLAIGLSQHSEPEAAHLLQSDVCARVIGDMMDQLSPDVMLCDLPPLLEHDDLSAFLPQVDGVLLVADGGQTLPEHVAACERRLHGQTRVLGVVLNQARRTGPLPAYA